jgi:hypothetical protein
MLAIVQKDPNSGHQSLHATERLLKGQTLTSFSHSQMLDAPSRFTLQLSRDQHILLSPPELLYTNHSCSPNLYFDTVALEVLVIKDVEAGGELCFFYPSTEWSMAEPFQCSCGAPECLGLISGAEGLSDAVLGRYQLSPYIREKWLERMTQIQ